MVDKRCGIIGVMDFVDPFAFGRIGRKIYGARCHCNGHYGGDGDVSCLRYERTVCGVAAFSNDILFGRAFIASNRRRLDGELSLFDQETSCR